ncbi:MAG: hypothetical protein RJA07_1303 [Bacteroidota bacterium]|jgi:hypothetical protein
MQEYNKVVVFKNLTANLYMGMGIKKRETSLVSLFLLTWQSIAIIFTTIVFPNYPNINCFHFEPLYNIQY